MLTTNVLRLRVIDKTGEQGGYVSSRAYTLLRKDNFDERLCWHVLDAPSLGLSSFS